MKVPVLERNLPNCITVARMIGTLCLIPVQSLSPVFYGLYTLTGLTDVLDGWIARKMGSTSQFGAKLDSIADLIFYDVMMVKIFPSLWATLPAEIWYVVVVILALRLSAYFAMAVKYRRFASLHTYLNKLTGAVVFCIPYVISLPLAVPVCWGICAVAAIASGEELLIHIWNKTYEQNRKTIWRK